MSARVVFRYLIPGVVFPALTVLAAKFIFATILNPSFATIVGGHCVAGQPFTGFYTGIPALDDTLCTLVAFFTGALQPQSENFTTLLVAQLLPYALFAFVEGARSGRSWLFSGLGSAIVGVTYQRFTGGVILPLYYLALIVTGAHKRVGRVSQRNASGLAFASIVGYTLPSVMMILSHIPGWIAIWQGFPVFLLLGHWLYLAITPGTPSANAKSGARTIQTIYLAAAFIAAVIHLLITIPKLGDVASLKGLLVPYNVTPEDTIEYAAGSLNTLQWDFVFFAGAAALASLWLGRNAQEVIGLAIWNIFASPVIGPGAALGVIYAWREGWICD